MTTEEQKLKMIELRNLKNPLTNKFYTLREIGKVFNLSRERIRQIIGNTGFKDVLPHKIIICKYCGKKKEIAGSENRIYCSRECGYMDKCLVKGQPRRLWDKEKWKKFYKENNDKTKEYRKNYYKKYYQNNK